jgi:hypothetical protein
MCPECAKATGGIGTWLVETIREDGLYTGKCPQGHNLLFATQTLPHELLFEIALNAIADGYNREAVSSFTASMERFFEFAIRVIAKKHGVPDASFADAWTAVSKQSERQLGAYIFMYLVDFATPPRLLKLVRPLLGEVVAAVFDHHAPHAFVEALATRIAKFDKWAIAQTKRLVNTSLLPDVELGAGWDACIASLGRPATQEGSRRINVAFATLSIAWAQPIRPSTIRERVPEPPFYTAGQICRAPASALTTMLRPVVWFMVSR